MTDRADTERAKMARRRRYLAIALLVGAAWYGFTRYQDHREAQRQARINACKAAKRDVYQAWYRYLTSLSLHQMKQYIETQDDQRDHDRTQRNIDELDATEPPAKPTVEDLKVLRALAAKWPDVEPPDFAALEAELAICAPE
ncbi:MAG: hypothetical protein JRI68_21230 [Deltaproteobacteria bacterium]|nr:hypothetical protein [Deltaproteobacteria bacterium]